MSPLELAFRLAVAGFVIVAPTLLFLGLWRVLMRLRDGELVERVLADVRVAEEWSGRFAKPTAGELMRPGGGSETVCPSCGESNPPGAAVCTRCLERL
jgi:hypothetical protein